MKYLNNCGSLEELKKAYRAWTKRLHPDCGGTDAEMKVLNAEYETMFERLKNAHNSTADDAHKVNESARDFIEILEKLHNCDGLQIEICGAWLWISGNTYNHRETLKTAGCKWSKNKSKWYYRPADAVTGVPFKRKAMSMTWIRTRYGSEKVNAFCPDPMLA